MDYLKTTPEKLEAKADQLNDSAQTIMSITRSMFATVNTFQGRVWSGEAATAYKNQFQELMDDAARMVDIVEELRVKLDMIAAQYKAAEDKNIATTNSLPDDVVE